MSTDTDKKPIVVLGLDCGAKELPERLRDMLTAESDVLCAGKPLLAALKTQKLPLKPDLLPIDAHIEALTEKLKILRANGRKITILTGGDPLFFGLAATLSRCFAPEELDIRPSVSSMQQACARLALPWHEMSFVSLHGRAASGTSWLNLARAAMQERPVCVLLDAKSSPRQIANYLLTRGQPYFTLHYFCELQNPSLEKHLVMSLTEASGFDFETDSKTAPAALLILLPQAQSKNNRPCLGTPDSDFEHTAGLLTKQPARAAILAALQLHPQHTLFDLGAGCGSVGIEACALLPQGCVFSIEQTPERAEQIRLNRQKHGAANLEIIQDEAAHFLQQSSVIPERIFIGGGLDKNPELITLAWSKLKQGGRLVIACVLLDTLDASRHILAKLSDRVEICSIQAARTEPLGSNLHLKAMNPVFILGTSKNKQAVQK